MVDSTVKYSILLARLVHFLDWTMALPSTALYLLTVLNYFRYVFAQKFRSYSVNISSGALV